MFDFPGKSGARRWIYRRKPGCIVLYYHRVATLDSDPYGLCVPPDLVRDQLSSVQREFEIVSVRRLIELRAQPDRFRGRYVCITFDDGYADNLHEALDVLRALGVPATIFIASGYIDGEREFWPDDLERIFLTSGSLPERLHLPMLAPPETIDCRGHEKRRMAVRELMNRLSGLDGPKRNEILDAIYDWSGRGSGVRDTHRVLTRSEVRELAATPLIDIGGHTVWHSRLAKLAAHEQFREISAGKQALEEIVGSEIPFFSYPFGGLDDYDEETVSQVKKCDFHAAFTTTPRVIRPGREDSYRLPRVCARAVEPHAMLRELREYWSC